MKSISDIYELDFRPPSARTVAKKVGVAVGLVIVYPAGLLLLLAKTSTSKVYPYVEKLRKRLWNSLVGKVDGDVDGTSLPEDSSLPVEKESEKAVAVPSDEIKE